MPQSLAVGAFVFGAVLLIIGLVGGGFKLFGAEMPGGVSDRNRGVAFVLGIVFILVPLFAERGTDIKGPSPTPTPTPIPNPAPPVPAPVVQPEIPKPSYVPAVYYAEARCSATGAWGWAKAVSPDAAMSQAVSNCISYGGIPACCSNGTTWRRIQ